MSDVAGTAGRMKLASRFLFAAIGLLALHAHGTPAFTGLDALPPLAVEFAREVDMRLDVPHSEQLDYAKRLEAALLAAQHTNLAAQYVVLVDRSPFVQAGFIYWRSPEGPWHFIGASPVSTGRPGTSIMRLQMHATDPAILEPRLGRPHSKGCIRIPASLNRFIDRYGLIDAEYERAALC